MKTNGYSIEKYRSATSRMSALLWTTLFMTWIFVIVANIIRSNVSDIGRIIVIVAGIILIIIDTIMFAFDIALCHIGKVLYRDYATQLVDYNNYYYDDIEDISVDSEKFHIAYHENGAKEVTEVDIYYDDYGIEKKVYKNIKTPIFYSEKGVIARVSIPFTTKKDKVWEEYEVQ